MITSDLRQLRALRGKLQRLGALNTDSLKDDLSELIVDQTLDRFRTSTDPDGSPWPPRQNSLPHPLLVLSGTMRGSIVARSVPGGVLVTTRGVDYASIHQWGGTSIPQRQFLGFGARDIEEIGTTIDQWLVQHVGDMVA